MKSIAETSYIDKAATIIGDVSLAHLTSVWPGAVLRGDMAPIEIGEGVNIQDGTVIHCDSHHSVTVGDYSLIGHQAMLHGCHIGRGVLIGIRAVVLDDAEIGDGAMVTANCIIRGKMKIPPFALVVEKKGELKIYENKARTVQTIAGSLEYIELARRIKEDIHGPFSDDEEAVFQRQAIEIMKKFWPEKDF